MDALQILRDDHRRIKDLFRRFDEAADAQTRKAVVDAAINELLNHTQVEEEIFYPALEKMGLTDMVDDAEADHHAAAQTIQELTGPAGNGQLEAKFRLLVDMVTEHITEEESQMFPRAAEAGYERLERIARDIQEMRTDQEQGRRRQSGKSAQETGARLSSGKGAARDRTPSAKQARSTGRGNLDEMSRDVLYERAQKANIKGRSGMNKRQLAQALGKGR
jgi:hemerythrin superfamily protein